MFLENPAKAGQHLRRSYTNKGTAPVSEITLSYINSFPNIISDLFISYGNL